jgi:hypothetical protein
MYSVPSAAGFSRKAHKRTIFETNRTANLVEDHVIPKILDLIEFLQSASRSVTKLYPKQGNRRMSYKVICENARKATGQILLGKSIGFGLENNQTEFLKIFFS